MMFFKDQRGFTTIVVFIGVIALFLVAFGGYLLGRANLSPTTTNETKELVLDDSVPSSSLTFQKILAENCKEQVLVRDKNGNPSITNVSIDLSVLPVEFSQDLVIDKNNPESVVCFEDMDEKGYVDIKYNSDYRMRIYDKNSQEPGHDGVPFLGPTGAVIDSKANPKFYVYLGYPSAGDLVVGEIPVYLRGIKSITLKNNETIFVSTDRLLHDAQDPLLMEFLKKHTDPQKPGQNVLYGQGIDQTYILENMTDLKKLPPAQKEAVDFVNGVLDDVKARSR